MFDRGPHRSEGAHRCDPSRLARGRLSVSLNPAILAGVQRVPSHCRSDMVAIRGHSGILLKVQPSVRQNPRRKVKVGSADWHLQRFRPARLVSTSPELVSDWDPLTTPEMRRCQNSHAPLLFLPIFKLFNHQCPPLIVNAAMRHLDLSQRKRLKLLGFDLLLHSNLNCRGMPRRNPCEDL